MSKQKPPMEFMHFINRSPDQGNGWRIVSPTLWPMVLDYERRFKSLVQTSPDLRVRLKPEAIVLLKWM